MATTPTSATSTASATPIAPPPHIATQLASNTFDTETGASDPPEQTAIVPTTAIATATSSAPVELTKIPFEKQQPYAATDDPTCTLDRPANWGTGDNPIPMTRQDIFLIQPFAPEGGPFRTFAGSVGARFLALFPTQLEKDDPSDLDDIDHYCLDNNITTQTFRLQTAKPYLITGRIMTEAEEEARCNEIVANVAAEKAQRAAARKPYILRKQAAAMARDGSLEKMLAEERQEGTDFQTKQREAAKALDHNHHEFARVARRTKKKLKVKRKNANRVATGVKDLAQMYAAIAILRDPFKSLAVGQLEDEFVIIMFGAFPTQRECAAYIHDTVQYAYPGYLIKPFPLYEPLYFNNILTQHNKSSIVSSQEEENLRAREARTEKLVPKLEADNAHRLQPLADGTFKLLPEPEKEPETDDNATTTESPKVIS